MVQSMGQVAGLESSPVRVGVGGGVGVRLAVGLLLGGVGSGRGVGGGGGGGLVVVMVVEGRLLVALAFVWADCWMSWGSCCMNWVMESIWAPSALRGVVTSPMAVLSLSFRDVFDAACLSWRLRSVSVCWSLAVSSCWKMSLMSARDGVAFGVGVGWVGWLGWVGEGWGCVWGGGGWELGRGGWLGRVGWVIYIWYIGV